MPYAAERMLHRAENSQINAEHCMESAAGCMKSVWSTVWNQCGALYGISRRLYEIRTEYGMESMRSIVWNQP